MIDFAKRTIVVLGQKVELNTADGLPIVDISTDMDRVAAQMAWWASVWAAAERQEILVEAEYRNWKSRAMLSALSSNPKDAEWKIRAAVEGRDEFNAFQSNKSLAREAVVLSKGVFESYEKKANNLQSRGASERSILERQGLSTPVTPKKRSAVAVVQDVEAKEPPMFTKADDEDDPMLEGGVRMSELFHGSRRPTTEEMVAEVKRRELEKKKNKEK